MIVYLEISFAYMYTNIVLHLLTYFCIKAYSRVFWILLLDTSITSPSLQRLLFLSRARAGKQLSLDNTSPPCNAQIQWTSTQEIHFREWGKIQNVNWAPGYTYIYSHGARMQRLIKITLYIVQRIKIYFCHRKVVYLSMISSNL